MANTGLNRLEIIKNININLRNGQTENRGYTIVNFCWEICKMNLSQDPIFGIMKLSSDSNISREFS
jgi:hypothetical protein